MPDESAQQNTPTGQATSSPVNPSPETSNQTPPVSTPQQPITDTPSIPQTSDAQTPPPPPSDSDNMPFIPNPTDNPPSPFSETSSIPPTIPTTNEPIIPPVIATPPTPSRSRAKIVGSILALLILAVGIPAGIFLVKQNQEVREKAAECPEGTTYNVAGSVRDRDGKAVNGATVCLDPPGSSCSSATFKTQTSGNGDYTIANVPTGGAGHNVYLDPGTLPTGYTVSPSVPNPKLVGPSVCTDEGAATIFVVLPPTSGGGSGGTSKNDQATCSGIEFREGGQVVTNVETGKVYDVTITMTNSSSLTWAKDTYKLGFPTLPNSTPIAPDSVQSRLNDEKSINSWGFTKVERGVFATLQNEVAPGGKYTFPVSAQNTGEPGIYTFYWRMFRDSVGWFGGECESTIDVKAAGTTPVATTCTPIATTGQFGYKCAPSFVEATKLAPEDARCTYQSSLNCAAGNFCYLCKSPTSSGGSGGGGGGGGGTPPAISAQCLNIKAYDPSGKQIAVSDLEKLKTGDKVRFAVSGTTSQGEIDRARFKINGQFAPDSDGTSTKDSVTGEFYYDYTIPSGVTSFSINAQLHHTNSKVGWF